MINVPIDYEARVYAGVLGKMIGVYLGRPFEGWSYDRIITELGEINYYVHEQLDKSLVVVDDDLSGTFTFLRALADYDYNVDLTPAQIGQTWLNYLIEEKTTLWWGGLGNSTEHTAYLRLKKGISAPRSGSIAMNGKVVAEQIGAQIFIDGWGMVCPGDPELAANLAKKAASVSHDGEAIYAAQVIAAMEAQAFFEPNLEKLLDVASALIPSSSVIFKLIYDLREWRAGEVDWRKARSLLEERYGCDKYPGNVHVVPNHGLIILSLLYGDDELQKTLMIVNTCGWDTDCNSGNVGCLLGIKNGLDGIDCGPDWRGPIRDRVLISSADGGRSISDGLIEAYHIANIGRKIKGLDPVFPKDNARFHFEQQGAVQGFRVITLDDKDQALVKIKNVRGHSVKGNRSLEILCSEMGTNQVGSISTPTFFQPQLINRTGYHLEASPTLYSGQKVRAGLSADPANQRVMTCCIFIMVYGEGDQLRKIRSPSVVINPGDVREMTWQISEPTGAPIAEVGLEVKGLRPTKNLLYLDYLTWDGSPDIAFTIPSGEGVMWRSAWVNAVDKFVEQNGIPFWLVQNRGRGLIYQGSRQWENYEIESSITPHMATKFGIALRIQGLQRYYALLLCNDKQLRLVKVKDGEKVLSEVGFDWETESAYLMSLRASGNHLEALIDGRTLLEADDFNNPLLGGCAGLVCEEGCISTRSIKVSPTTSARK